jgi:hypothetical protein
MTRSEFEREVASATGESVATIRNRGFSLMEVPDPEPLVLDWDELQQVETPRVAMPRRRRVRQAA